MYLACARGYDLNVGTYFEIDYLKLIANHQLNIVEPIKNYLLPNVWSAVDADADDAFSVDATD